MNRQPKPYDFQFTHDGSKYLIGWSDGDVDEIVCIRQNTASHEWDNKIAWYPGAIEEIDAGRQTVESVMDDFLESLADKIFIDEDNIDNDLPSNIIPGSNTEKLMLLIRDDLVYSSAGNGSVTY